MCVCSCVLLVCVCIGLRELVVLVTSAVMCWCATLRVCCVGCVLMLVLTGVGAALIRVWDLI